MPCNFLFFHKWKSPVLGYVQVKKQHLRMELGHYQQREVWPDRLAGLIRNMWNWNSEYTNPQDFMSHSVLWTLPAKEDVLLKPKGREIPQVFFMSSIQQPALAIFPGLWQRSDNRVFRCNNFTLKEGMEDTDPYCGAGLASPTQTPASQLQ